MNLSSLKYTSMFLGLLLGACEDAVIRSGAVYLSGDQSSPSALNYVPAGEEVSHGYVEVKFSTSEKIEFASGVFAFLRAPSNAASYSCWIGQNQSEKIVAKIDRVNGGNSKNIYPAVIIENNPEIFTGPHTLGCEIVAVNGSDQINLYLDGVKVAGPYIIGSKSPEDSTPIPKGKVGFGGSDSHSATSEIAGSKNKLHVLDFKFFAAKP